MKDRSTLVTLILLVLLTLLALGLRLYRLDAQSLWYDEGFSVYLARMDLAEITARTAADIQPPLYYYLLHGWIGLFGDGEAALRGLSVLFGVLTTPLIYAIAWQLFRSRLAGLLAALLLAVSPLHVWYGQEARMYTLSTFLCLLSSYFLLLVVQRAVTLSSGDRSGLRVVVVDLVLWSAFALSSIAAIYTHYFAFFVLVFQALYLLLVWWRKGFQPPHLVLGGLGAGLVILLAYLPWLPHLVTRYGLDLSYWPGRLKLHEVSLDVVLSFVGGESLSETAGIVLALGYGLVFLLSLVALVFRAVGEGDGGTEGAQLPLSFLLLYLLVPPALILVLSYLSPKFNARYAMLSQPALLLILAGGMASLWQRRSGYMRNLVSGTLAAVSLVFVLTVSIYANYNAYTDPAFARADFRGVARYLEKHVGPDETILLVSGHMYPVFDYYAPGVGRHRLPDNPTLDTTRTLDYAIAQDLNQWLADKDGVWVVLWQDEVVDPVGYLPAMLDEVGQEQAVDREFPRVDLSHYRLPAGARFSPEPAIAYPANANFGNQLQLLGYDQSDDRQVTLFWQALQPLDEDYRVSLVLRDTAGQIWGRWDGRPSAYLYPTDRWRQGQIVFGRSDLAPLPGTPPGEYGLEVGVYTEAAPSGLDVLDQAGAPQGKRTMLGGVRLSVLPTAAEQIQVPHPERKEPGGGLTLLGWDLDRYEAQPGDELLQTLIWQVESPPQSDYGLRVLLTDSAGQVLDAGTFSPTNAWHPTSLWQVGQAWRGQNTFRVPIETQPGTARLSVQLLKASGRPFGPVTDLTTIQVLPTERTFAPPQPQVVRFANFDDKIALLGADLAPDPVSPSGSLRVTLYWQALSEMDVSYTVFVHLLGPDGQVVVGHDGQPQEGARPTTGWVPGEYVIDPHDIVIPADLAPGEYVVEVGLYDAGVTDLPRLPVLGDEGTAEADRVIFGPVLVQ